MNEPRIRLLVQLDKIWVPSQSNLCQYPLEIQTINLQIYLVTSKMERVINSLLSG